MKKHILIIGLAAMAFEMHSQIYTPSGIIQGNSSNNNIGIGTTSPGYKLDISTSDLNGGIRVRQTSSSMGAATLWLDGTASGVNGNLWGILSTGQGNSAGEGAGHLNVVDYSNGSKLLIKGGPNGEIGIGITSPSAKLHVNTPSSSSLAGFIISHNYTGQYSYGELIKVKNDLTKAIAVENNVGTAKEVFKVMGDGRVIIGEKISTAHPTASLTVSGKVVCQDFYVTALSDWPDYVFANNYKLPALADVKKYYSTNKHLPGVPSASEIEENGLNLKEMSSIQMKKIEELTIYMVEMKEEIERLKKENEDLRSKIK